MARDDDFGHWNRPVKLVGVSGRRGLNAFGSYDVPEPGKLEQASHESMRTERLGLSKGCTCMVHGTLCTAV